MVNIDEDRSALFIAGNHHVFLMPTSTGRRIEQGLDNLTGGERDEWLTLEASGMLKNVHRKRLAQSHYQDGSNLAINVNLTGSCNLACTYCFADGGDYGRIYKKMDFHTIDYIFDFVQKHVTPSNRVRFEFFGGEPLLNFPVIKEICERSDRVHESAGISFVHRISTNLTVLPAGAVDLLAERNFIVSVSIDGGSATHDRNRPTKTGKGSFAGIISNCLTVRAASKDITMVARMTVVPGTASLVDDVRELHAYNIFDYFQIYPASSVPGASTCNSSPKLVQLQTTEENSLPSSVPDDSSRASLLQEFDDFIELYPSLYQKGNRFQGVLEYERVIEMLLEGKFALGFCGGGGTYFTFSPDDSIMPCHRLVGDTKYQIGNGVDGLTGSTADWTSPVDAHPVCSQCWAKYVCGGNCRQENHLATGDIRQLNEETCKYQQNLLEQAIRTLSKSPEAHLGKSRHLDDLFVSCGRPVVSNFRGGSALPIDSLEFFQAPCLNYFPFDSACRFGEEHNGHACESKTQYSHLSI